MKRFWKDLTGHYRYAIYSAKSELKSEVANSYLNWIWWVLEPFCFMLIYAFIFGVVFDAREQYFPLFIFIGITSWDFFSRCLNQSVKLLKNNKSIVTKVYIPKFILLISRMFFNGYKMIFSFGIIVVMLIYFKVPLTWNVIYVIPLMLLLFIISFACMTFLMHYGVFVQDLANVTNIVLRMLFYMTGIFYNIESRLPPKYTGLLIKGNPMALILSGLRKCILYGQAPDFKWIVIWMIIGVIVSALGIRKIYKNENSYVKVI
ncbi:MAG: ABC transporter permease [Eubacterium sp.]|nr:ABC transporter permease [Eubacterium sp.]MDD7209581.1 ABC transporter permease [Lachnospiraceae bacterium]MDY5497181.1 ABC transporter permease [Anaerobutyricum sp.]